MYRFTIVAFEFDKIKIFSRHSTATFCGIFPHRCREWRIYARLGHDITILYMAFYKLPLQFAEADYIYFAVADSTGAILRHESTNALLRSPRLPSKYHAYL